MSAPAPSPSTVLGDGLKLLPAVLDNDPNERLVTDTLLERLDLELELDALVEALAELLEHASAPAPVVPM